MIKDCKDCGDPFYTSTGTPEFCPKHRGRKRTEIQHGTTGAYTNDKCRCPLCAAAWSAYVKEWRARRAVPVVDS